MLAKISRNTTKMFKKKHENSSKSYFKKIFFLQRCQPIETYQKFTFTFVVYVNNIFKEYISMEYFAEA